MATYSSTQVTVSKASAYTAADIQPWMTDAGAPADGDAGNYAITSPIPIQFNGGSYTSLWINGDAFITFDKGYTGLYGGTLTSPAANKILFGSDDRRMLRLYYGVDPARNAFWVRWEGTDVYRSAAGSGNASVFVTHEFWFFDDGSIMCACGGAGRSAMSSSGTWAFAGPNAGLAGANPTPKLNTQGTSFAAQTTDGGVTWTTQLGSLNGVPPTAVESSDDITLTVTETAAVTAVTPKRTSDSATVSLVESATKKRTQLTLLKTDVGTVSIADVSTKSVLKVTGWKLPTVAATSGTGTNWTNPNNVLALDGAIATAAIAKNAASFNLNTTGYGFTDADIPAGAVIAGVEVEITRSASATASISDGNLQLLVNGAAAGTSHASTTQWGTALAAAVYGGPGDGWVDGLTDAQVKSANFGVTHQAKNGSSSSRNANVDAYRVRIWYAVPTVPTTVSLTASSLATGSPTLGAPSLTQNAPPTALTATGITTGSPSLGTPSIGQVHALTANLLKTSFPFFGVPAFRQVHALTATALATASPTLGSPTIHEANALTAIGIATGVPVLGAPALAEESSGPAVKEYLTDGGQPFNDSNDAGPNTLGTLFRVNDPNVKIIGIRFHRMNKQPGNLSGSFAIELFDTTGQDTEAALIASKAVGGVVAGWNEFYFDTPITPVVGRVYNAAYWTSDGYYSYVHYTFSDAGITSPSGREYALQAYEVRNEVSGVYDANGVFTYGDQGSVPYHSYRDAFYGVEPIFEYGSGASTGTDSLTASPISAAPPVIGTPAIGQVHGLAATALATAAAFLGMPTMTQAQILAALGLATSSPVIGSPLIRQAHALAASGIGTAAAGLGTPVLGQRHALTAIGLATAAAVLGSPAVRQAHLLSVTALSTGAAVLGLPLIGQSHALSANGLATDRPVLGSPPMGGSNDMLPQSIVTGAPVLGTPILTQAQMLIASGLATGPTIVGSPVIGQTHMLLALAIATASPLLASPSIGQAHALVAQAIRTASPVLGTPNTDQSRISLAAVSLLAGPATIGQAVLGQQHALQAVSIAASPALIGVPAIRQAHALTGQGIATAGALIGSPVLVVITALVADGIATAAPVIGSPLLLQAHGLAAADLVTAGPVFGSPTITQLHVLMAAGLATGSPVLGTPVMQRFIPQQAWEPWVVTGRASIMVVHGLMDVTEVKGRAGNRIAIDGEATKLDIEGLGSSPTRITT